MTTEPATPPPPATTAATQLVGLLGDPVNHSRSPQIHSAAIAAAGIDAVYLAFHVRPDALRDAVAGLRRLGARGCNLTIPHKSAVLELVDEITDEARFIGAANCLYLDDDGRLIATNTDCVALQRVLADDCGVGAGTAVTIVGAGGAARAAAVAAGRLAAVVRVRARRPEAADEVAALARRAGGRPDDAARADAGEDGGPRVVINATPLGRHGEPLPEAYMGLGPGQVALDLNYDPTPSPFLASAAESGGLAVDGIGMLVGQAEESFALWFRKPAPSGVMRAALKARTADDIA